MIVDASAVLDVLLRTERAAAIEPLLLGADDVQAPSIIDVEVAQVIRRVQLAGGLTAPAASRALDVHTDLVATVHPERPLLARAWALRANMTISDALYVALAEATRQPLLTTDERLRRAVAAHSTTTLVEV